MIHSYIILLYFSRNRQEILIDRIPSTVQTMSHGSYSQAVVSLRIDRTARPPNQAAAPLVRMVSSGT